MILANLNGNEQKGFACCNGGQRCACPQDETLIRSVSILCRNSWGCRGASYLRFIIDERL